MIWLPGGMGIGPKNSSAAAKNCSVVNWAFLPGNLLLKNPCPGDSFKIFTLLSGFCAPLLLSDLVVALPRQFVEPPPHPLKLLLLPNVIRHYPRDDRAGVRDPR